MGLCTLCNKSYDSYGSNHLRVCKAYCFQVHEHPATKSGRVITVERNEKGRAICKCVSAEGKVCNQDFAHQKSWQSHYATVHGTDSWLVSVFLALPLQMCSVYYRLPIIMRRIRVKMLLQLHHPLTLPPLINKTFI